MFGVFSLGLSCNVPVGHFHCNLPSLCSSGRSSLIQVYIEVNQQPKLTCFDCSKEPTVIDKETELYVVHKLCWIALKQETSVFGLVYYSHDTQVRYSVNFTLKQRPTLLRHYSYI